MTWIIMSKMSWGALSISPRDLDGVAFLQSDDLYRWDSISLIHDHATYVPSHHTLFAFPFPIFHGYVFFEVQKTSQLCQLLFECVHLPCVGC